MRVLFLTMWYPNPENWVSGTFVHDQAVALRLAGVDVRVMQPLPMAPFPLPLLKKSYKALAAIPDEDSYDGHPVYHPRYLTLPGHRLFERVGDWMYHGIRSRIASLYREWPFDIIHAHATYPCGYAANRCRDALFPGVKVLHTIHGTCIRDAPDYNRSCFEKVQAGLESADSNVFVSREWLQLGLQYTEGRIAGRSQYVTNGVNTTKFSLDAKDTLELSGMKAAHADTWNLVFVGNISEPKGVKDLLEAVRSLAGRGRKNLRLFLIGVNQLDNYINDYLVKHELRELVVLVGAVLHERVKIWMRFASAFILPSHSEGTPTVLFEALYVGAPSIFTQVGGVGDIVTDGQEALLIPPRSVAAIENAIAALMDDPGLCQQLAARGHTLIKSQFTWTHNAQAHLDIYQHLMGPGSTNAKA